MAELMLKVILLASGICYGDSEWDEVEKGMNDVTRELALFLCIFS